MSRSLRHLIHNLFYISASVLLAIFLLRSGAVHQFLASFEGLLHIESFVAGMFFTSIFTTAPAIVILGELSIEYPLWIVALFGGIGAVCGDYILFLVVRNGLSRDVEDLVRHTHWGRLHRAIHSKLLHHLLPFFGAIVLASPLPDEIGLAMLGFSKVNKDRFLLISLAMNTLGIFVIGLIARSIA